MCARLILYERVLKIFSVTERHTSDNRKYCIVDNIPIAEFIMTPNKFNGTIGEMKIQ